MRTYTLKENKMNTLLKFGVFIPLFFLWSCQAFATCPESGFKYDKHILRQVLKGDSARVFFVNVFGGPWPIPNRFEVVRNESDTAELILASPNNIATGSPECFYNLLGHISIGTYKKEVGPRREGFNSRHHISIQTSESGGLVVQISKWKPKARPHRLIISVLIHNKDQFIKITDQDPQLWKTMLEVHRALKEKGN